MRLRARVLACAAQLSVVVGSLGAAGCESREAAPRVESATPEMAPAATGHDVPLDAPEATPDPRAPCGPGRDGAAAAPVRIATMASAPVAGTTRSPAIGTGAPAAMEAFVEYCNHLGGLAGQRLDLEILSASTAAEQVAAVQRACDTALALVGSAVRLDDSAAQAAVDCGIPDIPAAAVNPIHSDATNVVAPLPNPVGTYPVAAARSAASAHPEAVQHAAILFSDGPDEVNALRQVEAYEGVGWSFVYAARLRPDGADADVHALSLAERGVRVLVVRAEASLVAAILERIVARGPVLDLIEASEDGYSPEVAASPAAEGLRVVVEVTPLEDPDPPAELERYRAWLDAVHPGAVADALGSRAWSAGLLFATAADGVGDGLSRSALRDALMGVRAWDGHGLHGPSDPGRNAATECYVVLRVIDGKFAREDPSEGSACDADGRVRLIGDYGEGAKPGA